MGWRGYEEGIIAFHTLRNFPPNVCEDLQQICSYTSATIKQICCKPKQTAEIFRVKGNNTFLITQSPPS